MTGEISMFGPEDQVLLTFWEGCSSVLRRNWIVYKTGRAFVVRYLSPSYLFPPRKQEREDFQPDRVILEALLFRAKDLPVRPAKQCMGYALSLPIDSLSRLNLLAIKLYKYQIVFLMTLHGCRRGGVRSSVRASGASSSSFRSGLVICSSLRHCSIGRSTAVSTPRLVTICGPSTSVVSNNSLNLDLAS